MSKCINDCLCHKRGLLYKRKGCDWCRKVHCKELEVGTEPSRTVKPFKISLPISAKKASNKKADLVPKHLDCGNSSIPNKKGAEHSMSNEARIRSKDSISDPSTTSAKMAQVLNIEEKIDKKYCLVCHHLLKNCICEFNF